MSVPPDFEDALGESLDVIDRELANDEVPLRDRPLRAARDFVTYCVMQVAVGEGITEPGKFLDYMASDWFKAIYARTVGWYTARYGQAVKSGSDKSHTGCILVLDTPFAMRIPVVTKRPGQPGETVWVCFPQQVEDDEDPLEWIVDGPNVRELPRSDGLKARRQAIEIANADRVIVTSIMALELPTKHFAFETVADVNVVARLLRQVLDLALASHFEAFDHGLVGDIFEPAFAPGWSFLKMPLVGAIDRHFDFKAERQWKKEAGQ